MKLVGSLMVCVVALCPSQQFFSHVQTISRFSGLRGQSALLKDTSQCLWSLEPTILRPQVYHSTTEPLHSGGFSTAVPEYNYFYLYIFLLLWSLIVAHDYCIITVFQLIFTYLNGLQYNRIIATSLQLA